MRDRQKGYLADLPTVLTQRTKKNSALEKLPPVNDLFIHTDIRTRYPHFYPQKTLIPQARQGKVGEGKLKSGT